ncbi:MAG: pseudouridine synthase [Oscillospiraceae bacterium]
MLSEQKQPIFPKNNAVRLDKFICDCGNNITRSAAKLLIKQGRVLVNGKAAKLSDMKISPESDIVFVGGSELVFKKHIYIMMNKPQGVVCSTRDGLSPTVLSLIPDEMKRKGLFPAGRLDKDTEGFVLITDDGELAHKMLSPKGHVPKLYYVELENEITSEYKKRFSEGIVFKSGEKCLPAELLEDDSNRKTCQVVLHEGMYHQVKRMFESMGNKVVFLKRICIGGLYLDPSLAAGECMEILHKDVEKLLERPVFGGENL